MIFSINKVIKFLILSDIALLSGLSFVTPIFAIFLTENIKGGNIEVVGFAAAIYWIVQSVVIIPFGQYLDKNHGEKDDLWFVIIGNLLAALVVFGYVFARLPWHIYFLQGIYALGMGMNIPGYAAIFTRHIDKDKEAFDWSVRAALVGIGAGLAGALGGIIAHNFGFNILFVGVGIFILLGTFLPLLILREMKPRDGEVIISKTKMFRPPAPKL